MNIKYESTQKSPIPNHRKSFMDTELSAGDNPDIDLNHHFKTRFRF